MSVCKGGAIRSTGKFNELANCMMGMYEPIEPMEFYRDIFPNGELATWSEDPKAEPGHPYTGIIVEIVRDPDDPKKTEIRRHSIFDDLDAIDATIWSDNFCLTSPISYVGKSRKSSNARVMYALCIEVDNLVVKVDSKGNRNPWGLKYLDFYWSTTKEDGETPKEQYLPRPTYVVASGNGLHLYYVFEKGIPLFPNVVKQLAKYKRALTKKIWNKNVTESHEESQIQYESIFQGFRMAGSITKSGARTQAFRTGDRVTVEYMNQFVGSRSQMVEVYKSNLTLAEAKEKYPGWYERRVENKEPKGHWVCKPELYAWWKRRIFNEAKVGKRYYCLMMLSIYAIKCDIEYDELEKDCMELMNIFEELTISEDNHFTEDDVMSALQAYEDKGFFTYPINSIANRSGLHIEKNKRNGRKQRSHLQDDFHINENGKPMINTCKSNRELVLNFMRQNGQINGRPPGSGTKEQIIADWRKEHPDGKKAQCARDTGLDPKTIRKWWKE